MSLPSEVTNVTLEMRGDLTAAVRDSDGNLHPGCDLHPAPAMALKDLRAAVTVTKAVPWIGWGRVRTLASAWSVKRTTCSISYYL